VKMKILAATGIVAVLLAASGVAMAVSRSTAPHTAANACVTSNGQLKLVQNGKCPSGTSPFTVLGRGGPGTALGYAHIAIGGKFDPGHSFNVKASNISSPFGGIYCFKGLKFTPHNAAVTLDQADVTDNGEVQSGWVILSPPRTGLCGPSTQAEVETAIVMSNVGETAPTQLPFYIVFY